MSRLDPEGSNEELIGKAIKSHRDKLTISTKMIFIKQGTGAVISSDLDGSPSYVKKACEARLKRLGIEIIDLYYLHRVDPNTPIEDSIGAMAELVKEGKIRHVGISEVKPSTIRRTASVHPIAAFKVNIPCGKDILKKKFYRLAKN